MLRVELYMVPVGQELLKRCLGTIEIGNIGGDEFEADYVVLYKCKHGIRKAGTIKSYQRSRGAWRLVQRAITKVGPKGICP